MMRLRVVCGRLETMATFSPTIAFIIVDFPTFGRPTIAAKPERNFVSFFTFYFLIRFYLPKDDGPKPYGSSSASGTRSTCPSHVTKTSKSGANSYSD